MELDIGRQGLLQSSSVSKNFFLRTVHRIFWNNLAQLCCTQWTNYLFSPFITPPPLHHIDYVISRFVHFINKRLLYLSFWRYFLIIIQLVRSGVAMQTIYLHSDKAYVFKIKLEKRKYWRWKTLSLSGVL